MQMPPVSKRLLKGKGQTYLLQELNYFVLENSELYEATFVKVGFSTT